MKSIMPAANTVDFHGVKMNWAGDMTRGRNDHPVSKRFLITYLIKRSHKGKPVHLLRDPDGTVWVLQTPKAVDASLTPSDLDQGLSGKTTARAGSSKRSCSPRTCRLIRIALAAGQLSFATILVTCCGVRLWQGHPAPTTCLQRCESASDYSKTIGVAFANGRKG